MASISVGMREFREKFADYALQSDQPIEVTRHGTTIGYFIPAKIEPKAAQSASLKEAATKLDALLAAAGFSEEQLDGELKNLKQARKQWR